MARRRPGARRSRAAASPAGRAPVPARAGGRHRPSRGRARVGGTAGRGPEAGRPRRPGRRPGCAGRPAPAASGDASRPACSRASSPTRARPDPVAGAADLCCSSATSGTTSLAASVGVDARTSATRSSSGESGSWPMADTTGVRTEDTARISAFVGERQQVLDRAAAAGHDDHVDVRVAVEPLDGLHHLCGRPGPLHRRMRDLEHHGGPASPSVLEHVALGGGAGRGDQADASGEERQRALPSPGRRGPRPPAAAGVARSGRAARRGRPSGSRGRPATGCRGWRSTTASRARRRWRPRPAAG